MDTLHTADGEFAGVAGDTTDAAGFLARFAELVDAGMPVDQAAVQAAQDDD